MFRGKCSETNLPIENQQVGRNNLGGTIKSPWAIPFSGMNLPAEFAKIIDEAARPRISSKLDGPVHLEP